MPWLVWVLAAYLFVALIIGSFVAAMAWDSGISDALKAAALMGLGWPFWLIRFLLPG